MRKDISHRGPVGRRRLLIAKFFPIMAETWVRIPPVVVLVIEAILPFFEGFNAETCCDKERTVTNVVYHVCRFPE